MTITMAILWNKYGRPRDASDASIDERCVTEANSSCTCLIKIGGSACTIKDSVCYHCQSPCDSIV